MSDDLLIVATSQYLAGGEAVAEVVPEHRDWVLGHYESGVMLASGPQEPRVGGVLLLRCTSLDEARAIVDADPLVTRGVARYDLVAFQPTPAPHRSSALDAFLSH
jgi:uncharacterized protein YciI